MQEQTTPPEQWRPIPSAPGFTASSLGRIRNTKSAQVVHGWTQDGYRMIQLGHKKRKRFVHQLVAEAFLGLRPIKHEVNHKDGNKANNTVKNLEWVTSLQNRRHAQRLGLNPGGAVWKLSDDQVAEIRLLHSQGTSNPTLAKRFNISPSYCWSLTSGKARRHIGLPWRRQGRRWQ